MAKALLFVLDGDELLSESTGRPLRVLGFKVELFSSYKDLLNCSRLHEAACLLLDVQMPELDGLQVQNQFADRRLSNSVIGMTGRPDEDVRSRILETDELMVLQF
jgi:two-component system response regulator FixJ